jgi:hypothetical protein
MNGQELKRKNVETVEIGKISAKIWNWTKEVNGYSGTKVYLK